MIDAVLEWHERRMSGFLVRDDDPRRDLQEHISSVEGRRLLLRACGEERYRDVRESALDGWSERRDERPRLF